MTKSLCGKVEPRILCYLTGVSVGAPSEVLHYLDHGRIEFGTIGIRLLMHS